MTKHEQAQQTKRTVPPTSTPDAVATVALAEAVHAAAMRFPDATARIERASALVRARAVIDCRQDGDAGGLYGVRSAADPALAYVVVLQAGVKTCTCEDFTRHAAEAGFLCKHLFAVCLHRKATRLLGQLWFASLEDSPSCPLVGIAAPRGEVWAFYEEGCEDQRPFLVAPTALTLAGNCGIAGAQDQADGPLWQRVGASATYQPWRASR